MVSSAVSRRGAPTSVRWRPEAVRHAARLRRSELLQLRSAIWGSQPDAVSDGFPNDEARRARKGLGGAARFGVVGASGLAVNEASIALFVSGLGLHYVVGYLLATQCSTLWNFTFVEFWAFRDAEVTNRRWHRYVLLVFVNNLANVLTAPLFILLTSIVGINYLVSNILTLGIVFLGRFVFADRIWGGNNTRRRKQAVPAETPATTQLDPSCCHAESLMAARAGSRRLAFPSARRRLYDALITEGDALEQFGFDTFSRYAVALPRLQADYERRGRELHGLRARLDELERQRAELANQVAACRAPTEGADGVDAWVASEDDDDPSADAPGQPGRKKWFPIP